MMETNSSTGDVRTTNLATTPLRVTLALSPDPTRDYTEILRDIVDLAFEASTSIPVEIIIVDPADSRQAISDGQVPAVITPRVVPTPADKQPRIVTPRHVNAQRRPVRLETCGVSA